MKKFKSRNLLLSILAVVCAVFLGCAVTQFATYGNKSKKANAYVASQTSLGSIYDYTKGEFSTQTINNLAVAANPAYSDKFDLINDVVNNNAVITANAFNGKTVNFGKVSGSGAELEWIPAYISKAVVNGKSQATLTLWLATVSDTSKWAESWSGKYQVSPSCNMYSSSYIHALINNGHTSTGYHAANYSGASNPIMKANSSDSTISSYTKYSEFVTGGLFDSYIVAPKYLSWQMSETGPNDPSNTLSYLVMNGTNYSYNGWTEDNLWIPSTTETGANGSVGVWNTTYNQRTSNMNNWLRTGVIGSNNDVNAAFLAYDGQTYDVGHEPVYNAFGVRPALHLNLSAAFTEEVKSPTVDNTTDTTKTTAWDDSTHDYDIYFETSKSAITKIEREDVGGTKSTLYSYALPTSPTGTGTATPNSSSITCTVASTATGSKLTLKQAGKYTVTLDLIDKDYSDVSKQKLIWEDIAKRRDTGGTISKKVTIYVTPKLLTKPTVATGDVNGQEYTGQDITFTLTSPDTTAVGDWAKYIQLDGACPADLTDNNDGSFKAKKVNDYKFKLKLADEENTVWSDRGTWTSATWSGQKGGSTNELKLTVKARTLNTVLTNTDNWNWSVGKSGVTVTIAITNFGQLSDIDGTGTDGQLKFKYYYANADGSGETAINASDVTETFDSTQGTATIGGTPQVTGTLNVTVTMPTISTPNNSANPNYIFGVKPLTTTGMDANYTVSSNSAEKKFTIGSAVIDLDTLVWSYNEDGVASNKDLAQNGHVTYKKNAQGTAAVEYEPQLLLYREDASNNVVYDYSNASNPVLQILSYSSNGGSVQKASAVNLDASKNVIAYTTTVKIKLVDTVNSSLKATGNPAYIRVDTTTNTAEIDLTWYIDRAKVNLSTVQYEYGWLDNETGDIKWEGTYSSANKPSFRDSFVYIRVKGGASYPEGITNAVINDPDYLTDRDAPGQVTAKVNYTLDDNYYYEDSNNVKWTGTFTENGGIELAKKKIPVSWTLSTVKDGTGAEVKDDNGLPYQIYVLDFGSDPDNLKQYIKYEYYYADVTNPSNPIVDIAVTSQVSGTTDNAQLDYLIDQDGAGKFNGGTSTKAVPIFVRAVIDASVTGSGNYELNVATGSFAEQFLRFGQKKNVVDVTVVKDKLEYGTAVANIEDLYTVKKGTATYGKALYDAVIYHGTDDTKAVDISTFEFATANAGTYTVKLTLKPSAAATDALNKTSFEIEITAKEIDLPQVTKKIEFNSETINFADYLDAKYQEYLDKGIIKAVGGAASARDVASAPYIATLEITDSNYKWKQPASAAPSKSLAKASLAEDEIVTDVTVDAAQKTAEYSWSIAPYRLPNDILNTSGKNGATVNTSKLPAWAQQLITDGSLTVGVRYYTDEACTQEAPVDENGQYVLEKKATYYVKPYIGDGEFGQDSGNFTFATDGTVTNMPAKAASYTVPQSGAAAVLGNIKDFMTKTWLGLPVWAWFLIGLALIILLIVIIVVAVKRRKTKEEREAKKAAKQAAKEEAAAKAEAERARIEAEREAERMRLESQREIEKMKAEAEAAKAKAQAEAEIAKMRAQAQAQMQAMPQQMPMPQPMAMPQQMPVQQQMPQQYHQPVQQTMPQYPQQQMPVYGPMPQQSNNDGYADLKAEMRALKAEQNAKEFASMKSEFESMKMRMNMQTPVNMPQQMPMQGYTVMPQQMPVQGYPAMPQQPAQTAGVDPDMAQLAELIVLTLRKAKEQPAQPAEAKTEPQQVVKAETASVVQPAVYPPDAVITTTTTVDTTKATARAQSTPETDERDRFFDIDGFYDKFEG